MACFSRPPSLSLNHLLSPSGCRLTLLWYLTIIIAGYIVSLLLRLLGGEYYLNFKAVMKWPWYDEETNIQNFPFRTICMLIGLILNLLISYLFKRLFETGKLDSRFDVFNAVVNERNTTIRYTSNVGDESTADLEFDEMKEKRSNGQDNKAIESQDMWLYREWSSVIPIPRRALSS